MFKKLFLTGIFVVCTFVPVFADDPVYVENGDSCNNTNLGDSATPTLRAEWEPHTIHLDYDPNNGDPHITNTTCEYGGGITLPDTPSKTGYSFMGWRLKQCNLSEYYTPLSQDPGVSHGFVNYSTGNDAQNNMYAQMYGLTEDKTLAVVFQNGTLYGKTVCSSISTQQDNLTYEDLTNENGEKLNCWCTGTKFGDSCSIRTLSWKKIESFSDSLTCTYFCTERCATLVKTDESIRQLIFGIPQQ